MKKLSEIFSYKLGFLCVAIGIVCSIIHDISGVKMFTTLAVVCGLVAIPCFFRELIRAC